MKLSRFSKSIKRVLVLFVCMLIALLVMLTGCKDNATKSQMKQLIVTSDTLIINEEEPIISFFLVSENGAEQDWEVLRQPLWLEINPSSGTISDELVEIEVTGLPYTIVPGMHSDEIKLVSSTGATIEVIVKFEVFNKHALASVSVDNIALPDTLQSFKFRLDNNGTDKLSWEISNIAEWLILNPENGQINSGSSNFITAQVNKFNLEIGNYETNIEIISNSAGGNISLPVNIEVPAMKLLEIRTNTLQYDYTTNLHSVYLYNHGNSEIVWNAISNESFIVFNNTTGTISAKDSVLVQIEVDRTSLSSGLHHATAIISSDNDQMESIDITLYNFQNSEGNRIVDYNIIDAEYSKETNKLVIISSEPQNRLYVINQSDYSQHYIDLDSSPLCVSISQDGNYAAIGYDGLIDYVNLLSYSIEATYTTSADVGDIVLNDDWVYAFPKSNFWERIRCIELSSGVETVHTNTGLNKLRGNSKAKLHPSGHYLYVADTDISPGDIHKYDIIYGTANYMYDSQYHGTHTYSTNLWLPTNDDKIFISNCSVYLTNNGEANDIYLDGTIEGMSQIAWIDYNISNNDLYVIKAGYDNVREKIHIIDGANYSHQGEIDLPEFLVSDSANGTLHPARGRFVFVNSEGDKIYCLATVNNSSNSLAFWTIIALDIE